MTIPFAKLAAAAVISLCASFAMAQTPAPKPMSPTVGSPAPKAAPTPAPAPTPATKPARTSKSLECSKEADAKGLHGKARKKFMSACKRGKTQG